MDTYVCVCVHVCVRSCARACVRECAVVAAPRGIVRLLSSVHLVLTSARLVVALKLPPRGTSARVLVLLILTRRGATALNFVAEVPHRRDRLAEWYDRLMRALFVGAPSYLASRTGGLRHSGPVAALPSVLVPHSGFGSFGHRRICSNVTEYVQM